MKKYWVAILAPVVTCALGFWASRELDKTKVIPDAGVIVAVGVIGLFIILAILMRNDKE